jgi:hypothetical protein
VQGNQNKGAFINSGNIFGNLGINLNHFGEYDRIGLTTDVSVRYTGQEYLNLGNTFIPGGSKEMSGNLRKYLLEDKLQLQAKFQYREYDFSANSKTWQYASWSFSGKWKFSKGQFFELRYQPFNNSRKEQSTTESQNSANRFSVRGNIQARLSKGVLYRNYLDITTFDNIMEHLASALEQNTNAVTLTSLQTLSLKNRTYFLNSVYNHTRARSEFLFLNSSLTIDGGSTFQIKDGLMLNCAIVYNSVQGFYSNGSLRQGISGRILGRFDLSGFVQSGIFFYKEAGASGVSPFSGNVLISYKIK